MALVTFDSNNFLSPVIVDAGFLQPIQLMDNLLEKHCLQMKVNDTIRYMGNPVKGAIVHPATHSDHFVGHAIDGNFVDPSTGHVFLHNEMQAQSDMRIKAIISKWKDAQLRWGGDFKDADAVHFDDDLFHRNPQQWQVLFNFYQKK